VDGRDLAALLPEGLREAPDDDARAAGQDLNFARALPTKAMSVAWA
jgi:hypothetical protein